MDRSSHTTAAKCLILTSNIDISMLEIDSENELLSLPPPPPPPPPAPAAAALLEEVAGRSK